MADKPTLPEVLRVWFESFQAELHTALPGKVKAYDPETQTADIIPVIKQATPRKDGSFDEKALPVIPNVPVCWPRTANTFIHLPLAAGDYVLLVFNEAAIGHWRAGSGEPAPPGDVSRHSPSYPYAIPGGFRDGGEFSIPDGYGSPVVVKVQDIMLVTNTGSPPAQFVAGGEKVNDELALLQGYLSAFIGVLTTWFGTFGADSTTLAPVAPTMQPGAAAVLTAASTLTGQLSSWPSATVEMDALKTE